MPWPFPQGYVFPCATNGMKGLNMGTGLEDIGFTARLEQHVKCDVPRPESNDVVDEPEPAQIAIAEVCDEIKELLLEKNRAYGNSALEPVRIFSKASTVEQINVRIDDKLSRLARGHAAGEDVELDLIGYLVLKRVHRKMNGGNQGHGEAR